MEKGIFACRKRCLDFAMDLLCNRMDAVRCFSDSLLFSICGSYYISDTIMQ